LSAGSAAGRSLRQHDQIPLAMRARCRWDSGNAIARGVRATDLLFEASGTHGILLDNPIQRAWREVGAMRAHAGNNPERASLIFGGSEFGLRRKISGSEAGTVRAFAQRARIR
jgi:alkylation response protein AidB-like acyl-CoA dehydrogenase